MPLRDLAFTGCRSRDWAL